MSFSRLAILVVCLLVSAAPPVAAGGVYLYLQPLPADAGRLSFTVASLSAVSTSGSEHPLQVGLKSVGLPGAGRQRLLASGPLPAGSYTGFVLRIGQAALKNAQGEARLAVPEAPVRLDAPFAVGRQRSALFWLVFDYQGSLAGAPSFAPAFSVFTPPRPIPDHAGFVTNSGSDTITVFDKSLSQAAAVIDTCGGPAGMALDQRRRRAYVACAKDDEIRAIDAATGEMIEFSTASPGDRPSELALTPDGTVLVSANTGSNSVSFFDASSLARQERVNVGSAPASLVIDDAGRRVFVFNTLSSSISVLDVSTRRLVATVSTDAAPLRGRFNRRGDRLYVIHERSPYMTVLDPQQLTVVTRARLRIGVSAIEVDPVRGLICVGGENDPNLEFYDPNALLPLYSMRAGAGVSYLSADIQDNTLYMVSPENRSVIVGRLSDRKALTAIDVGDRPYWVSVMGEK